MNKVHQVINDLAFRFFPDRCVHTATNADDVSVYFSIEKDIDVFSVRLGWYADAGGGDLDPIRSVFTCRDSQENEIKHAFLVEVEKICEKLGCQRIQWLDCLKEQYTAFRKIGATQNASASAYRRSNSYNSFLAQQSQMAAKIKNYNYSVIAELRLKGIEPFPEDKRFHLPKKPDPRRCCPSCQAMLDPVLHPADKPCPYCKK
jgi:hypothetical protein